MPFLSPRRSHLLLLSLAALSLTSTGNAEVSRSAKKPLVAKGEWTYAPKQIPHRDTVAPPANLRYVARDISGIWEYSTLFGAEKIKVFPMTSGKYHVLFCTTGCVAEWTSERTATYKDGVLLLDRPGALSDVAPAEYRLFTIRTSQGIRLISDRDLYFYLKGSARYSLSFYAFEKRENPKAHPNSK